MDTQNQQNDQQFNQNNQQGGQQFDQYNQQNGQQFNQQYQQNGQQFNQQQYQQNGQQFNQQNGQQYNQQYQQNGQQYQSNKSGFEKFMDTPDYTANTTMEDIQANKVMAVLGYIGILFLVPYLAAKDSKFAQFHANQGLVLFITNIAFGIASTIVSIILSFIFLGLLGTLITFVGYAALFALWIIGIVNAASGRCKELPLIGKFHILK